MILTCGTARGQSDIDERSQEIIAGCIEAMGSEMALSAAIESLEITGTGSLGAGELSPIIIRIKGPEKIWTQYGNGLLVKVINGDVGWFVSPGQAPILHSVDGQTLRQRGLPLPYAFLAWLEFKGNIRFAGEQQIDDARTWRLEFTNASGGGIAAFFDQESGMLVRSEKGELVTEYEFRRVGDIQVLTRVVMRTGMNRDIIEFTEVDFDADIADDLFKLPPEIKQAVAEQKESNR
ncbi:MAG: hypothetical protein ACR2NP_21635 [Pirellulaceae bacterium]